mmetsp:Transcript_134555/g.418159  ORF Transcript_134555/g.418159 Transcript_134555/m.418159 type:complete len:210 (+) Transcript_134555:417-1046(+)
MPRRSDTPNDFSSISVPFELLEHAFMREVSYPARAKHSSPLSGIRLRFWFWQVKKSINCEMLPASACAHNCWTFPAHSLGPCIHSADPWFASPMYSKETFTAGASSFSTGPKARSHAAASGHLDITKNSTRTLLPELSCWDRRTSCGCSFKSLDVTLAQAANQTSKLKRLGIGSGGREAPPATGFNGRARPRLPWPGWESRFQLSDVIG